MQLHYDFIPRVSLVHLAPLVLLAKREFEAHVVTLAQWVVLVKLALLDPLVSVERKAHQEKLVLL